LAPSSVEQIDNTKIVKQIKIHINCSSNIIFFFSPDIRFGICILFHFGAGFGTFFACIGTVHVTDFFTFGSNFLAYFLAFLENVFGMTASAGDKFDGGVAYIDAVTKQRHAFFLAFLVGAVDAKRQTFLAVDQAFHEIMKTRMSLMFAMSGFNRAVFVH
jgi:hypothetical protein